MKNRESVEEVIRLRLAVEQGYAPAQFSVAVSYANGEGVPQNHAEPIKWYSRAADNEFSEAQFRLGTMYIYGLDTPKNHAEAVKWFRRAADNGHAEAKVFLELRYNV